MKQSPDRDSLWICRPTPPPPPSNARVKISRTKCAISRSFHQQFLCHLARLHKFHKAIIFIRMHCQKSVTNIMNNFEIALKFSVRAEKYTESTLGCLRRNTCLIWIALPSFPALFPPPSFLPSSSKTLRRLWEVILLVNMTRQVGVCLVVERRGSRVRVISRGSQKS